MTIPLAISLTLLSLDAFVGNSSPLLISRFAGYAAPAIHAELLRTPEENSGQKIEVAWFLDGDTLAAPLGTTEFTPIPQEDGNPALLRGQFSAPEIPIDKPTRLLGALRPTDSTPENPSHFPTFRLVIYPQDYLHLEWEALAKAAPVISLCGPLPGLREFLKEQGIPFQEGDWKRPETIERNGVFIGQIDGDAEAATFLPLAKSSLLYAGNTWMQPPNIRNSTGKESLMWVFGYAPEDFDTSPFAQQLFLQAVRQANTNTPQ